MLDVITSLPPEYMCANRTADDGPEVCQVQVEVVIHPDDDQSCLPGETYPQAVVGYASIDRESMPLNFPSISMCQIFVVYKKYILCQSINYRAAFIIHL